MAPQSTPSVSDFPEKVGVLVVGAGPTGLGAATRLHQHGCGDWLLIDAAPEPGGLACTDATPEGFLFDMGGHVIFSHYRYFDELIDAGVEAAERLPCPNDGAWASHSSPSSSSLPSDVKDEKENEEERAVAAEGTAKKETAAEKGGSSNGGVSSSSNVVTPASSPSSSSSRFWNTLQRVSYVRLKGKWIPYPFQNNVASLSDEGDRARCLTGLALAAVDSAKKAGTKPANFDEWILRSMGEGIADLFMRPYNFKVWAHPTTEMGSGWLGERVASPDLSRAIGNAVRGVEDAGWGPNAVFRFPRRGGTGAIWRGVASLLPGERKRLGPGSEVVGVDVGEKRVELRCGAKIGYECLISTLPLDTLLSMIWKGVEEKKKKKEGKKKKRSDDGGKTTPPPTNTPTPPTPSLSEIPAAVETMLRSPLHEQRLRRSASHIVGVGIRGSCPHGLKCWLYFPEGDCPFYRATVFSNYSERNCPPAGVALATICLANGDDGDDDSSVPTDAENASSKEGPYWSLMFEVSESDLKPVDVSPVSIGKASGKSGKKKKWPAVVADSLRGAVATGLLSPDDQVVSLYHRRLEHGYPTPSLGRDDALKTILPWLRSGGRNVWSRGRFGSWKYEVGNQDHSLMLGVEAADSVLFGAAEATLELPDFVNSRRNDDLRYAEAPRANGWRKQ